MEDNKIKNLAAEAGVELTDDMLDDISGGYIPKDIWKKMPTAERQKAQQDSFAKRQLEMVCEELDPNIEFIPEKYR